MSGALDLNHSPHWPILKPSSDGQVKGAQGDGRGQWPRATGALDFSSPGNVSPLGSRKHPTSRPRSTTFTSEEAKEHLQHSTSSWQGATTKIPIKGRQSPVKVDGSPEINQDKPTGK